MRWGSLAALACSLVCAAAPARAAASLEARPLPRLLVLSEADAQRYREAFAAIEAQDWPMVRLALRSLEDRSLEGPALARLLTAPNYPGRKSEYADWLERYPEQPLAAAVADRARALGLRAAQPPKPPQRRYPGARTAPPGDGPAAQAGIEAIVQRFAENDWAGAAQAARAALYGPRRGEAEHWLGLLAWRAGAPAEALTWFEASAAWPHHTPWDAAGAQWWAARSALALGEAARGLRHLRLAAAHPTTLYGQLAGAQLGRAAEAASPPPVPEPRSLADFLQRHPGALRAAGLAQLGRLGDVELELERLHGALPASEDGDFLVLAQALAAPRAQLRAAEYGGAALASGYCPAHTFAPEGGYRFDPAAVSAVIRQESRFTPVAVSRSRAQGLMQLLPSTAEDLAPGSNFKGAPQKLHDPALNLRLGQEYLAWLLQRPAVEGDLARAFAAYNGGPGWLGRWLEKFALKQDPLLVLEALPRAETRAYAERVFAFFVTCRAQAGQAAPELDALASGQAARYSGRL